MTNESVMYWDEDTKDDFLKEGSRRVFYRGFALYYSNIDNTAQLVVSDYRTGCSNKYYFICQVDTTKYDNKAINELLLKNLNCVIRKINNDNTRIAMKNI